MTHIAPQQGHVLQAVLLRHQPNPTFRAQQQLGTHACICVCLKRPAHKLRQGSSLRLALCPAAVSARHLFREQQLLLLLQAAQGAFAP